MSRTYEVLVVYRVEKAFTVEAEGQVAAENEARTQVFFEGGDVEEVLSIERLTGDPYPDDDDYEEEEELDRCVECGEERDDYEFEDGLRCVYCCSEDER